MVTWQEDRLTKFQDLVDLDEIPLPPPAEEEVAADWREKLDPSSPVGVPGWNLFFRHVWAEAEEAVGEWGLRQEREQLSVKIFVSSNGVKPARHYFRRLAMSSTAEEYPYKPPPEDPSTVSGEVVTFYVPSPSLDRQTHNDSVLRLFRNLVFDVRAYDATINVLKIADDLLSYAQTPQDPSLPGRPEIKRKGPPEVVSPDVQIQVPVAPDELDDFQDTDFEVDIEVGGKVAFLGFDQDNARFRWKQQPGDGWIRVQVIDRRTLLSRTLRIPPESSQPPED